MELKYFQKTINYQFKDEELLRLALTHRSYKSRHNERLEFLGDAVLDLIVGEHLYRSYPDFKEGELSKMRAGLVNEKGLAFLAKEIKLDEVILLSNSEIANGGKKKDSILSNAFEAIVGAMYLDADINIVKNFVLSLLKSAYKDKDFRSVFIDYKTTLQEVTQARFSEIPLYELIQTSGPDHKKTFLMQVSFNGKIYAKESGNSKKNAEQNCAKKALVVLEK